jgi:hypothetical protein
MFAVGRSGGGETNRKAARNARPRLLGQLIDGARVIMAARHRNRNARALVNLDALIERARGYSIAGLRAFIPDLQEDWERKARVQEGVGTRTVPSDTLRSNRA